MYMGIRRIRSAGRTSGSIEVTLPTQLQLLEGVDCQLVVREGPRPEIVLQPDLSAARALFERLWAKLGVGLGGIDELGAFSPADFTLTLFPSHHWQERPPLAYADALAVLRQQTGQEDREPETLTRILAFLAVVAGGRFGLEGALALAFGDAVAYLITGTPAGLGTDFERGMAHRIYWGEGIARPLLGSPFEDIMWQRAQTCLRRVYEQFRIWQKDLEAYTSARENWYRALTVEMGLQVCSVDEHIGR